MIVHSLDGYDEISLTGPAKVIRNSGESLMQPEDFRSEKIRQVDLYGGSTVESAAAVFDGVLSGKGTVPQNKAVIANAALALQCAGVHVSFGDCLSAAEESLASGRAKEKFKKLISVNAS